MTILRNALTTARAATGVAALAVILLLVGCCCSQARRGTRPSTRSAKLAAKPAWDEARYQAAISRLEPIPDDVEPEDGIGAEDDELGGAAAPTRIRLKKSFVKIMQDRVTIYETAAVVLHASGAHHCWAQSNNDSDAHMAIQASFVNLPVVAELKNCDHRLDALERVADLLDSGDPVRIEGVWRCWCEHPKGQEFDQTVTPPTSSSSNPAHVFEIHPILKLGDMDVSDTLIPPCTPVAGQPGPSRWEPKTATNAFGVYDGTTCEISSDADTITIQTRKRGLNHMEFLFELAGSPHALSDGLELQGDALTLDGQTVVHAGLRCVTPNGAPPAAALSGLAAGDKVHVIGMPRISLKQVRELVDASPDGSFSGSLPYEITIVGVLP